jgi:lipopolysaccharide/colanic/teichoic acid biosynthesis glycosyltransferase
MSAHVRRCFIDDLPQIFKVVPGPMLPAGPYPGLSEEAARYVKDVRRKALVKGDLTGLRPPAPRTDRSLGLRIL